MKGQWKYFYRAVDKQGKTVDFLLTAKRDRKAAKRFFTKAIKNIGFDIYKTFGDFLGNNFEQFTSPRLIMICKK